MGRRALLWCAFTDAMPLYGVYALLFSDTGLTTSEISVLFILWSATAVLLEVPTGAFADRFTARSALVASGLAQGLGYALWVTAPGFTGFALGFVLWGASGSLQSGAFESLLYTGLERDGATDQYPALLGRCEAVAKVVEVVATLPRPLLVLGGFAAVGWASVAVCLLGSCIALGFPGVGLPASGRRPVEQGTGTSCGRGARSDGWRALVRRLVLVLAGVTGLTAFDEYIPLMARASSVPDPAIPVVLAGLPLAASAGFALAGVGARLRPRTVGLLLGAATVLLAMSAVVGGATLLVGVGAWWVLINMATVLADARLQDAVSGQARATVTSVAGLGSDLAAIGIYLVAAVLT
ncbi:MAG: MFS transporter [Acidimicrobiales bacterium]